MSDTPEASLQAFVRSRSESAFRALYDVTTPGMLGLAMRLTAGDRATAEDIVQEAWFRAVERVERFAGPGSAARWLNGFVLNCWNEQRRSTSREDLLAPDTIEGMAVDGAPVWSESPLLMRAVHSLPDGYRAVLVLHDIEGYTHAEIAGQMGIEEGTSKSQLARARRQLRSLLGVGRREDGRKSRSTDAE